MAKPDDLTLDHLLCRAYGGSNENTNLITACRSCNSQRSDRKWKAYATAGAIERINRTRYRKVNIQLSKSILAGKTGDPRLEAMR